MKHLLVVSLALAVAACSGGQKTDTGKGSGAGGGSGSGAGSGSAVAADAPITRSECEAMVGHILDVGIAETPAAEKPSAEQIEAARKRMIEDETGMQKCMAFDRKVLSCVMKAGTSAALEACLDVAE